MGRVRSVRHWFMGVVMTSALLAGVVPPAGAAPERDSFIVVFKDTVENPGDEAREQAQSENAELRHVYQYAIKGYAAVMSETAAARIANNPRVAYVERDAEVQASAIQDGAPWGLDRIDHRTLALDTRYAYETTGAGVTAYVIDTGIRNGRVSGHSRVDWVRYDGLHGQGDVHLSE